LKEPCRSAAEVLKIFESHRQLESKLYSFWNCVKIILHIKYIQKPYLQLSLWIFKEKNVQDGPE
jgi:hypothetical protein